MLFSFSALYDFLSILLTETSIVSLSIWKNMSSWVFNDFKDSASSKSRPSDSCYFDSFWKTLSWVLFINFNRNHAINYSIHRSRKLVEFGRGGETKFKFGGPFSVHNYICFIDDHTGKIPVVLHIWQSVFRIWEKGELLIY